MRVHVSARLDEGLWALIVERALVEQRTLTGMVERLLTLGLGQVVDDERVVFSDGSFTETVVFPAVKASRHVPAVCPNERFHRPGTFCKQCGLVP